MYADQIWLELETALIAAIEAARFAGGRGRMFEIQDKLTT